MSKAKNKHYQEQQKKHLANQYRANFFNKMKLIINSECGEDIFSKIPTSILNSVYQHRFLPFRFSVAYGCNVSPAFLETTKVVLSAALRETTVKCPNTNIKISLTEYYTVCYSMLILLILIQNDQSPLNQAIFEKLNKKMMNMGLDEIVSQQFNNTMFSFMLCECDLSKAIYWLEYKCTLPISFEEENENKLILNSFAPETRQIKTEEGSRPAIRVGWVSSYQGLEWIQIRPSVLGYENMNDDAPLDVYIQHHALNRLKERIDCFLPGINHFQLFLSLKNPKIAYDSHHKLLIEYRYYETKAGYFRADIVDGVILLRTFLFATNTGTPEGRLLEKKTGLKMLDKKYLAIDKLSSFMNSDLDQNEEVRQLLKDSGCECLIDFYDSTKTLMIDNKKTYNFNLMLSYLNKNEGYSNEIKPETILSA